MSKIHIHEIWSGFIYIVDKLYFTADLFHKKQESYGIFNIEKHVLPSDRKFIHEGVGFTMVIGSILHRNRKVKSVMTVVFNKVNLWKDFDINFPSHEADEMFKFFNDI